MNKEELQALVFRGQYTYLKQVYCPRNADHYFPATCKVITSPANISNSLIVM